LAFWSGEKLNERLKGGNVVSPFKKSQIDCAAYQLRLGREFYVSSGSESKNGKYGSIGSIAENEGGLAIPAGQFAFLITEEEICMPDDAIAFISIRAKTKFRGLVNVSGFHVDPGYSGRLVFSVFNAGPAPVHLVPGEPHFLIWFSDLDRESQYVKSKSEKGYRKISSDLINPVAGELHSFQGVIESLEKSKKRLDERMNKIEKEQTRVVTVAAILGAIVTGLIVGLFPFILRAIE